MKEQTIKIVMGILIILFIICGVRFFYVIHSLNKANEEYKDSLIELRSKLAYEMPDGTICEEFYTSHFLAVMQFWDCSNGRLYINPEYYKVRFNEWKKNL